VEFFSLSLCVCVCGSVGVESKRTAKQERQTEYSQELGRVLFFEVQCNSTTTISTKNTHWLDDRCANYLCVVGRYCVSVCISVMLSYNQCAHW
jgi:hypothetical protein